MNNKEKNNRRSFLKIILSAGSAIGLLSPGKSNTKSRSSDKVKMLTADGKLVEIEKSVLDKKVRSKRATNEEVFEWMNSKHKNI